MAKKDISDKEVISAQNSWFINDCVGPYGYEILMIETGQCEKVCLACIQRAVDRGLLDYGVSLRTAWLTDKGKELL